MASSGEKNIYILTAWGSPKLGFPTETWVTRKDQKFPVLPREN